MVLQVVYQTSQGYVIYHICPRAYITYRPVVAIIVFNIISINFRCHVSGQFCTESIAKSEVLLRNYAISASIVAISNVN